MSFYPSTEQHLPTTSIRNIRSLVFIRAAVAAVGGSALSTCHIQRPRLQAEDLPDQQVKEGDLENSVELDAASFSWDTPPLEPEDGKGMDKEKTKGKGKNGKKKPASGTSATPTPVSGASRASTSKSWKSRSKYSRSRGQG